MRRRRLALLLAVAFVPAFDTLACGEEPEKQAREETPQEEQTEAEAQEGPQQSQQASYYGEEFAGGPTASGELYDPYGFTAAHPYLPLGTELMVSYEGRIVIVTVNDRSSSGLDLSLGAAQAIGLTEVGTAVVDVEVVGTRQSA